MAEATNNKIENQGSKSPVGSRKKQSASPSRSSSRSSSWGRRRRESKQSHDKKSSTPRDGYRHYNRARFERYNSRDRMLKRRASRSSSSRSRSRSRSPRLRPARRGTSPRYNDRRGGRREGILANKNRRYDRRDDFDRRSRYRRSRSPPPRRQRPMPPRGRTMEPPFRVGAMPFRSPPQAPFRADLHPVAQISRPKQGAELYELYKAAEQKKTATKFFGIHKHSEWFRRRYDPRLQPKVEAQSVAGRRNAYTRLVQNLKEFGLPTLDAAANTNKVKAQEPTPAESAKPTDGDDKATKEAPNTDQPGETAVDAVTNDNEGGNLSNNDSEDSGEILEDNDEPETENTSKVQNKPAEATSNADDKATANLSARRAGYDSDSLVLALEPTLKVLCAENVPGLCPRDVLIESIGVSKGLEQVLFSQPCKAPPQSWGRMVYLVFRTEADAVRGLEELDDKIVIFKDCRTDEERQFHFQLERKQHNPVRRLPPIASSPAQMQADLKLSLLLSANLDQELNQNDSAPVSLELLMSDEGIVPSSATTKERLDFAVEYLRQVHSVCYYSGKRYLDMGDCLHSSGGNFVRVLDTQESGDGTVPAPWTPLVQELLKQLSEDSRRRKEERLVTVTAKATERSCKATNSFIENNTVKEAPNRFRCKLPPNKLFKSEKFVRKHILNKQKSALAKIVDKALEPILLDTFLLDPDRPMPPTVQSAPLAPVGFHYSPHSGARQNTLVAPHSELLDRPARSPSKRPRRSPSPVRPPSQNKRIRHDNFRDIDAEVESPMLNRTLVDYSDF